MNPVYDKFHGERFNNKNLDSYLRDYFPNYSYKGVFIDVGAYEGINISNSYHFEKNGWKTLCIEANPLLIPELKKVRENVYNYAVYDENKDEINFNAVKGIWGGGSQMAGVSAIELDPDYMKTFAGGIINIRQVKVKQIKLTDLLMTEIPEISSVDIISIDVEGGELKVLKGFDIEKYKPKIILVENFFKRSDISEYLANKNYVLDKQLDYNQIYIQKK